MEQNASRTVSAEISRSWLLVAATRPETFDAAESSRADQIILDIEDAVDPRLKDGARADVVDWLSTGGSAWVRINDRTSAFWSDDVDALVNVPGLRGVMLAKAESPEHVSETFDRLHGVTPVIALVESALGIEEAANIARARGAYRLAFGSGDYRRDTGTSADDMAMAYPRSRLVVASRVGKLPGPIDGPTVGTNHALLREQGRNRGGARDDRQAVPRHRTAPPHQRGHQPHQVRCGLGTRLPRSTSRRGDASSATAATRPGSPAPRRSTSSLARLGSSPPSDCAKRE